MICKRCKCGCNEPISKLRSDGKPRLYLNGHNRRGVKHNKETLDKMSQKQKGEHNPNWIGGRWLTGEGYYRIWKPDHPYANSIGFVLEHRFIYEQYHNICVLPWTDIHHKNGIKTDNRIENLEALLHNEHTRLHKTQRGVLN